MALDKQAGLKFRPAGVPLVFRRWATRIILLGKRSELLEHFVRPQSRVMQLAAGTPSGPRRAALITQLVLDSLPVGDRGVVSVDIVNAFNSFNLKCAADFLASGDANSQDLKAPFCYLYDRPDNAINVHLKDGKVARIPLRKGVAQGCNLAMDFFCAVINPILHRAADVVRDAQLGEVVVPAYADNITVVGPIKAVLLYFTTVRRMLRDDLGLELHGGSLAAAPADMPDEERRASLPDGCVLFLPDGVHCVEGISIPDGIALTEKGVLVAGIPVGADDFIRAQVALRAGRITARTVPLTTLGKGAHDKQLPPELSDSSLQSALYILLRSTSHAFRFILDALPPTLTSEGARAFDSHIVSAFADMLHTTPDEIFASDANRHLLRMPSELGGLGIGGGELHAPAFFLASLASDVPFILSTLNCPAVTDQLQQVDSATFPTIVRWRETFDALAATHPLIAAAYPSWAEISGGCDTRKLSAELVEAMEKTEMQKLCDQLSSQRGKEVELVRFLELTSPDGSGLRYALHNPRPVALRQTSEELRVALLFDLRLPLPAGVIIAGLRGFRCTCNLSTHCGFMDKYGVHALCCKQGMCDRGSQEQHAALNMAVAEMAVKAGAKASKNVPGAPRLQPPQGVSIGSAGTSVKYADLVIYYAPGRPEAVDGANVGVETTDEEGNVVLTGGEITHARAVAADIARDGYTYVPQTVELQEKTKNASSARNYDQLGFDFAPFVMSQRGVISKTAQEFVWKYVRRAAGKVEVQRYLGARSEKEARATVWRWFRSELCASHVRHRSRRIIAYYRSFNIIGGRGSITPMVHVRPLERRAPYIVTQDGPFDFAVSDYPRSSR